MAAEAGASGADIARRVIGALCMLIGGRAISAIVDAAPYVGSPQIDYPTMDISLPYWPQFILQGGLLGLVGALMAALGVLMWSRGPVRTPPLRSLAISFAVWLIVISVAMLGSFLAWGTMGPLHVPQPIVRFAVTNGAISATVITGFYAAAGWVLGQAPTPARVIARLVVYFAVALSALGLFALALAMMGAVPARQGDDYAITVAVEAGVLALLAALVKRPRVAEGPTIQP